MPAPLPSLVLYAILWAVMTRPCLGASDVEGNRFTVSRTGVVTSYETLKSARSKTDCFQAYSGLSNCESVAYDRQSKNCYLNPVVDTGQANSPAAVKVYNKTSPVCSQSDVTISKGYVHQWSRTLESLEGPVVCDVNYIFNNYSTGTARCTNGDWTVNGECKQYYFHTGNYQTGQLFEYKFPQLPPFLNRGVCAQIKPMDTGALILKGATNRDMVMYMQMRFYYYGSRATVFGAMQNDVWVGAQNHHMPEWSYTFPFEQGQDFALSIKLTTEGNLNVSESTLFPY